MMTLTLALLAQSFTYYPPSVSTQIMRQHEPFIEYKARRVGVPPSLVKALIATESNWDHRAVSPVGAIGLMQLMPSTAEWLNVNPWDPRENIDGGVRYLGWLLQRFEGRVDLALAAYNAGPAPVIRCGCIPNYPETQAHVYRTLQFLEQGRFWR